MGFSRLNVVEKIDSTQTYLYSQLTTPRGLLRLDATSRWPHLSALRAISQTAGRGRGGRSWVTPERGALLVSTVLYPGLNEQLLGWLPLVIGDAVAKLLASYLDTNLWQVGTKWPNDVLIQPRPGSGIELEEVPGWGQARKVCGVLCELVANPNGSYAVIAGVGINVAQSREQLPVDWAGSLALAGANVKIPALVLELGTAIDFALRELGVSGEGPAKVTSLPPVLHKRICHGCLTLGQQVQVGEGDDAVAGIATDIRPQLVISTPSGEVEVQAGDVLKTRFAS